MFARISAPYALALSLLTLGCAAQSNEVPPATTRAELGLMTTLPLYWGEAADVGELLRPQSEAEVGWVRPSLEERFDLVPLDVLSAATLAPLQYLVLAQPRVLSGPENVALDAWVRGGGRLLLLVDPMLTRHSRYPIGDRRRPQDVALLSPILSHWGLALHFDEEQAEGERIETVQGFALPLDTAGRFVRAGQGGCAIAGNGVLAQCRIGKGAVVALADAALLDEAEGSSLAVRQQALTRLLSLAFN